MWSCTVQKMIRLHYRYKKITNWNKKSKDLMNLPHQTPALAYKQDEIL